MYVCMFVCMYVCMYVYMYTHMYACMYVCSYVCMYVYMYTYMYACMYVCSYVCIHVCMCVYIYVCMYVCLCLHVLWYYGIIDYSRENNKRLYRLYMFSFPLFQTRMVHSGPLVALLLVTVCWTTSLGYDVPKAFNIKSDGSAFSVSVKDVEVSGLAS